MKQKTRRRFLRQAARSAAGAFVCTGVWPGLFKGIGAALAADQGPKLQFPTAAREQIAIAQAGTAGLIEKTLKNLS